MSRYQANKDRVLQNKKAEEAASGPTYATLGDVTGYSGETVVSMPNLGWYYSSADAYSANNPNSPFVGAWNYGMSSTEAVDAYYNDAFVPPNLRSWLDAVAYQINPLKKGASLWEEAVRASALSSQRGEFRTPFEILNELYGSYGSDKVDTSGGSSGYGGGGFGGGSSSTVNLSNPEDARAVIDQLALKMIGRNVSDREFKEYYKTLTQAEMSNPSTARMDVDKKGNPVQVVEEGLGPEGRTAVMQESLRGNQAYNEYTLGSQAVNLMSQYLQERGIFRG
jgi:hypothetical protein